MESAHASPLESDRTHSPESSELLRRPARNSTVSRDGYRLQFGGVPVIPAGHAAATGGLQFGGVPVIPAGHAAATGGLQFGGVPV
jgi:hypothetical protein